MKTQISKLTLEVIRKIDAFWYYTDNYTDKPHRFTDEQFQAFLWEQMILGCDPIEIYLNLDNGEAAYYVDSPKDAIYFFEAIIEKERNDAIESLKEEGCRQIFKSIDLG